METTATAIVHDIAAHVVNMLHMNGSTKTSAPRYEIGSNPRINLMIQRLISSLSALPDCAGAALYLHAPESGRYVRRVTHPRADTGGSDECPGDDAAIEAVALSERPTWRRGRLYAVPIHSDRNQVAGVVTLMMRRSGRPSRSTMLFAAAVAKTIACVLECEQTRAASLKHEELLDALERLTRGAPSSAGVATLEAITRLGPLMIAGSTCALYIQERHQAGLHLAASYPALVALPPICPDAIVRRCRGERSGARRVHLARDVMGTYASAETRAVLVAPITIDAERRGALLFIDHSRRRFRSEESALVERLAQVAGIVLTNRELRDRADERARPDQLLWELLDPINAAESTQRIARARLGQDLARPHVVIVASAPTLVQAMRLRDILLTEERNSLVHTLGTRVVALLPERRLPQTALDGLSIGVSRPRGDPASYPAAYREAEEALAIGTKLFGQGGIFSIEALQGYRLIPAFMKAGLSDTAEYLSMDRLPDDLLRTLDVYLDAGGNATRAAKQLFLHRNTLRQRLDRISALIGVDLAASERWLPLQLAVKASRLARIPPAAAPHAPEAAPRSEAPNLGEVSSVARTLV